MLANKQTYSIEWRVTLIGKLISVFFVLGILFSFKLWTSSRLFPLIPLFDVLHTFPASLDLIYISFLIFLFIANIFYNAIKLRYLIFALLLLLLLQDQMRWQPWVYVYILMSLPFLIEQTEKETYIILNYLQFILVGIYFWSGVHKLNTNFIDLIFKNILIDFFRITDTSAIENLRGLGYCIPLLEISIAFALIIPKMRQIGVWLACILHLFILFYLSPLGINSNSIVYPWNVGMIIFVLVLFGRSNNKLFLFKKRNKLSFAALFTLTLIWIFPLFNFFNCWDNSFSFLLYSGKIKNYYIAVEEKECQKIIEKYNPSFILLEGITGGKIIDINKWSYRDLNVPFNAERRIFKKICKDFCALGIGEPNLVFLEFDGPFKKGRYTKFACSDL